MLGNSHFYNRTIRKVVVAFGTIFNDIQLVRYTKDGVTPKEHFKVPLSYGSKEKYITRLMSDPTLNKSIATSVPRISFELTGMTYDSSRKLQSTVRNFAANSSSRLNTQYVPVPYDFEFSMSIYVRNTEDGTQILEQILPFFTPDFNVTVNFINDMNMKYDMPVILNSVTTNTEYEGDMQSTRFITWDLTFTTKGNIWPAVKQGKVIRQVNSNIYLDNRLGAIQKVYLDTANGTGTFINSEDIGVDKKDISGKVVKFDSGSGLLILSELNKTIEIGHNIKGLVSGSSYVVDAIDPTPVKLTAIVTKPDPLEAEPDDEFGFSETFTHWPNTLT
jgi:hypothetical protein